MSDLVLSLIDEDISNIKKGYTPSKLQADALFHFVNDIEYIIEPLQKKRLIPRYCAESVGYLGLEGIKKIAFPMKCFCDISFHRLEFHLMDYGYYGLAFKKEWGMRKGIQPVQYIDKYSAQRKDFSKMFNQALKASESVNEIEHGLKNFLLEQMLFYKPYDETQSHKSDAEGNGKCFADECEWRYVPEVGTIGLDSLYYENDKDAFQQDDLKILNNVYKDKLSEVSLQFRYDDLKYIIIKQESDFDVISNVIMELNCGHEDEKMKHKLLSKIIIWENEKGDF